MPLLALAAAGPLLVAGPAWVPVAHASAPTAKTPEPTSYAERGGVLLGNALVCGIATDGVFKVAELVEAAIRASARDKQDGEAPTARFTILWRAPRRGSMMPISRDAGRSSENLSASNGLTTPTSKQRTRQSAIRSLRPIGPMKENSRPRRRSLLVAAAAVHGA